MKEAVQAFLRTVCCMHAPIIIIKKKERNNTKTYVILQLSRCHGKGSPVLTQDGVLCACANTVIIIKINICGIRVPKSSWCRRRGSSVHTQHSVLSACANYEVCSVQAQVIIKINLRGIRNPHDVMEEAVNTIGRAGQSAVRMRREKNYLTVSHTIPRRVFWCVRLCIYILKIK